jgi:16S rRNA (guanine527-N7)-methyltransferase
LDQEIVIKEYLKKIKIPIGKKDLGKIFTYLDLLYCTNKEFNLVGTKEKEEIFIRHILDSISLLENKDYLFSKDNLKIIDVGTGAGLPGVLLAILLKDHDFLLMDKSEKKINFIKEIKKLLEIENMDVVQSNAVTLAHDKCFRESFDLVIARAVTKINILLELIIPFCRINGKIILYKSRMIFSEINNYSKVINTLGTQLDNIFETKVPFLEEYRAFLVLSKTQSTDPKYPRSNSKIKKEPLI